MDPCPLLDLSQPPLGSFAQRVETSVQGSLGSLAPQRHTPPVPWISVARTEPRANPTMGLPIPTPLPCTLHTHFGRFAELQTQRSYNNKSTCTPTSSWPSPPATPLGVAQVQRHSLSSVLCSHGKVAGGCRHLSICLWRTPSDIPVSPSVVPSYGQEPPPTPQHGGIFCSPVFSSGGPPPPPCTALSLALSALGRHGPVCRALCCRRVF